MNQVIHVDRNGDQIVDREPGLDDFVARPAAPFRYGGTIPVYVPGEASSSMAEATKKCLERVEYEIRAQRNRILIEKAVFKLSQTDDGLRLLKKAWDADFRFVFDHERVEAVGAAGLCSYDKKTIALGEGLTVASVELILKHELQHFEDFCNGVSRNAEHTLQSAVIASRGVEANARVSEAVYAMQMMYGRPDGPDNQFRSAEAIHEFQRTQPEMALAALKNKKPAKEGRWQEFANAVFYSYYRQQSTLEYYDGYIADSYCKALEKGKGAAIGSILTKDIWNGEKLAEKLTICGKVFLRGAEILNDDFFKGLTGAAVHALRNIRASLQKSRDAGGESAKGLEIPMRKMTVGQALKGVAESLRSSFTRAVVFHPPSEKPFDPFVYPARIDGIRHTDGRKQNAASAENFNKGVKTQTSGYTEIDKIHFAMSDYIRHEPQNIFGAVNSLLEAGMRMPIAAFTPEYLHDLHRRVRQTAGKSPEHSMLSGEEIKLFSHWQEMEKRGFDPIWGTPKAGKPASGKPPMISAFGDLQRNAAIIRSFFASPDIDKTAISPPKSGYGKS